MLQFAVLFQRQQKAGQVPVSSCKNSDLHPDFWRTRRRSPSLYICIELMENPWVESATWQWVTQASSRLWGVDLSQFEEEPNQWRALSGLDTHRFMSLKCGESGIFLQRFCLNAHGFLMPLSFSLLFIPHRSNCNIVLGVKYSIYLRARSLPLVKSGVCWKRISLKWFDCQFKSIIFAQRLFVFLYVS